MLMLRRPTLLCSLAHVSIRRPFPAKSSTLLFAAPMATLQRSAFFEAIEKHDANSTAVLHCDSGRSFKYGSILHDVAAAKDNLLQATGKTEEAIAGERVAFLVENGYDYVGAQSLVPIPRDVVQRELTFACPQSHSSPSWAPMPSLCLLRPHSPPPSYDIR